MIYTDNASVYLLSYTSIVEVVWYYRIIFLLSVHTMSLEKFNDNVME
jgi:hypothetical protein